MSYILPHRKALKCAEEAFGLWVSVKSEKAHDARLRVMELS
jgi:hypothetical protein